MSPPFIATIGYVRSLKISRLSVTCEGKRAGGWPCYHHTIVPIGDEVANEVTLDSIEARLRCQRCGTLGAADVRPEWSETTGKPTPRAAGWMMPPGGDTSKAK